MSTLNFEFMVENAGPNGNASPALRLLLQDGGARSELIWEAAYNDANGAGAGFYDLDTWYTSDPNALFWRFVAGEGATLDPTKPGSYVFNTIAGWAASSYYTDSAFVSGLSVGNGSGSGTGFVGYADNVTATGAFGSRSFNFAAAVPEPGTWAMMLLGFGGIGAAMRRQRRANARLKLA
nr:PEPxxWA-CTERM sorting domain-containing protein [uncultured Sphingomonas sp.]